MSHNRLYQLDSSDYALDRLIEVQLALVRAE